MHRIPISFSRLEHGTVNWNPSNIIIVSRWTEEELPGISIMILQFVWAPLKKAWCTRNKKAWCTRNPTKSICFHCPNWELTRAYGPDNCTFPTCPSLGSLIYQSTSHASALHSRICIYELLALSDKIRVTPSSPFHISSVTVRGPNWRYAGYHYRDRPGMQLKSIVIQAWENENLSGLREFRSVGFLQNPSHCNSIQSRIIQDSKDRNCGKLPQTYCRERNSEQLLENCNLTKGLT